MSTSIQADYTLVSWLEEAENALTNDLYLVSQYDADTNEWISKKLSYGKLCALVLNGIDNRVSATCSAYLEDLSTKINTLSIGLSSTSCLLDDTVSAVIKMANCIQVNKSNISAISGFLLNNVIGENGISVIRPANLSSTSKLKIGHQKSTTAATLGLYKVGYDKFGHISSRANVTAADILNLGNIISGAGEGLVADQSKHILSLSAATATTLGGIKVGDNLSITDGKLSARDTTYGPATATKIGLVKPGTNLAVAADGTLSARDTTYTVGQGLAMSGTKISLSSAGVNSIGGIKVGATKDTQKRIYPVTLSSGYAYVSVDWISGNVDDFVATLDNNTLKTSDQTYAVTGITQQAGNVTKLLSSNYVYTKLTELSTKVNEIDASTAVKPGNGVFIPDNNTVTLYAAPNASQASESNLVADFNINPYVVSGEYTNTKYEKRGDGRFVTTVGDYLKFAYNYVDDPTPATSAFYVDLEPVLSQDQFVQSAWYVSTEHTIVIEFKDASKDRLSIDIGDMINVYGQEGDVAYLTPNDGIKSQTILRSDVYVCENDNDLQKSLANKLSFKEVFDNWHVGDMYNNKNYGYSNDYFKNIRTLNECLAFQSNPTAYHWNGSNFALTSYSQLTSQELQSNWQLYQYRYCKPDDASVTSLVYDTTHTSCIANMEAYGYNYWVYNSTISSIIQPMNTYGWSFYYSPLKYTNYDIEVELASTNSDNDYIGLVAAVNEDSSGKQHVLSFVRVGGTNDKFAGTVPAADRTAENSINSWMAIVDGYSFLPNAIESKPVAGEDTHVTGTDTAFNRRWSTGGKTKIKISRRGNSLTAQTTPFYTGAAASYDNNSRIVLNLASVSNLTCFSTAAGGGSVGFTTNSQPMSYYKILSLNLPKTIAKTYTNELCTFYGDGSSTCIQGNIAKEVGVGRMLMNLATSKTFYTNNNNFMKIADLNNSSSSSSDNRSRSISESPMFLDPSNIIKITLPGTKTLTLPFDGAMIFDTTKDYISKLAINGIIYNDWKKCAFPSTIVSSSNEVKVKEGKVYLQAGTEIKNTHPTNDVIFYLVPFLDDTEEYDGITIVHTTLSKLRSKSDSTLNTYLSFEWTTSTTPGANAFRYLNAKLKDSQQDKYIVVVQARKITSPNVKKTVIVFTKTIQNTYVRFLHTYSMSDAEWKAFPPADIAEEDLTFIIIDTKQLYN